MLGNSKIHLRPIEVAVFFSKIDNYESMFI